MKKETTLKPAWLILVAVLLVFFGGCSKAYYGAMEKVGVHKRDILVDRVEGARDAQSEAQEQFKSALEQFGAVVQIEDTDLKRAYDKLNAEYETANRPQKKFPIGSIRWNLLPMTCSRNGKMN